MINGIKERDKANSENNLAESFFTVLHVVFLNYLEI